MGRSWWLPARTIESGRAVETNAKTVALTGAGGGYDTIDTDLNSYGFRAHGSSGRREVPQQTVAKARAYSVAGYRANPMARAIVDTYTSFAVGDSGVIVQCSDPTVRAWVDQFWRDPANQLDQIQEILFRSHMLLGETVLEMLVGPSTGVTRFSYVDPDAVTSVGLHRGNPLWLGSIRVKNGQDEQDYPVVRHDELSGLRDGQVMFWRSWRALVDDRRGQPFLAPILDWLDAYDRVLFNLTDRTALARYFVWDVSIDGDETAINDFVTARGGRHVPPSGSIEIHNKSVEWTAKSAQVGSFEDTNTTKAILTNIAGGTGLAKTWLAEPEDANRATSLTMAEPVRRRVGGVQRTWIGYIAELVRFAVDQGVAHGRLPELVTVRDESGEDRQIAACETVSVHGPEIANADAKIAAEILMSLSTGLAGLQTAGLISPEAAKVAVRKGWEDFTGRPYRSELDGDTDSDAVAERIGNQSGDGGLAESFLGLHLTT